jgi:hypothetical protein
MTLPVTTVPGPHDERRLIRKARTGDRAAFGELYRQYASMVHGLLLARVPPDVASRSLTRGLSQGHDPAQSIAG